MRIGIDIRSLETPYRTGVGEFALDLLKSIFASPSENEYFLFSNAYRKNSLPFTEQANVQIIKTNTPNKIYALSNTLLHLPKIDNLIEKKSGGKIDAFYSPNLNFTSLKKETKHILTIHDLSFIFFPHYFSAKQRLWHRFANIRSQIKKASHLMALSENTKRDLVEHIGVAENKITVLYPGVPSIMSRENNSIEQVKIKYNLPDRYILYVGTLEERKNIHNLIRGFELAANHLPKEYSLVLAGTPGMGGEKIKERISRSPLSSRIHVLGYIDETSKRAIYEHAALLTYPSFYEGFGLPVLEAMSVGTPVVTSNRSSLPEVAGGATHMVNPNYPEEIAEGIEMTLNNTGYRDALIKKGALQSQQFSWQKSADIWLDVVKKISSSTIL